MLKRIVFFVLLGSLLFAHLGAQALARTRDDSAPNPPDIPYLTNRTTWDCNTWLTLTNYGMIGSFMGELNDPETGKEAPSCEFPAESGLEYLYEGAIWVGAIVNGDTLVSTGTDGWWDVRELFPEPYPQGDMTITDYYADREINAVYYDTCTGDWVEWDPIDNRPHIPLGLKITKTGYCWITPGYDDFVILKFRMENIGSNFLQGTYLGIAYDGDVHQRSIGAPGAQDDICGFVEAGENRIAWIGDTDGDPSGGVWDYRSVRSLAGIRVLQVPPSSADTCFNWWVSNINPDYDWGPQRADNYRVFHDGNLGTPTGDANRYFVMSNGDHDYDQPWCAIDHSGQGWLPPPPEPFASDLANGYDTRFLISVGPFDISPGEVEEIAIALVAGEGWHVNPDDANQFIEHPDDPAIVEEFYARLDFSDFLSNSDIALIAYQNNFLGVPPGPPKKFRVEDYGADSVALIWNMRHFQYLYSYNIYRTTESGQYNDPPITPQPYTDTSFVDYNVQEDSCYYYVITSTDTEGREGAYSPEVRVRWPKAPTRLVAEGGNQEVYLAWRPNTEDDLFGYIMYRADSTQDFIPIDTTGLDTSYVDPGRVNGLFLWYYITALDSVGNESDPSDTVWACPMGFDSGILLVDATEDDRFWFPPPDSVNNFYERALEDYNYTYWDNSSGANPPHLTDIANYSTIIWYEEHFSRSRLRTSEETLRHYLDLGGKFVLIGWKALQGWVPGHGQHFFEWSEFPCAYLKAISVDYPFWPPDEHLEEFIGGFGTHSDYPDFGLSSSRVDSLWMGPYGGMLPFQGCIQPDSPGTVLFKFNSAYPETSHYHNQPIGIGYFGEDYETVLLDFPLYFAQEPTSIEILHKVLRDIGVVPSGVEEEASPSIPTDFALHQNYPNPFNVNTTISYQVPVASHVKLKVYNILGQKVATLLDEKQAAGYWSVIWETSKVSSGLYLYKLTAGDYTETKRMILVK